MERQSQARDLLRKSRCAGDMELGELLVFLLGRGLLVDNEELGTSFLILHVMIIFVAYVLELIFLIF